MLYDFENEDLNLSKRQLASLFGELNSHPAKTSSAKLISHIESLACSNHRLCAARVYHATRGQWAGGVAQEMIADIASTPAFSLLQVVPRYLSLV